MTNRRETNLPSGKELCWGKKAYDSHAHAKRAAKNLRRYEREKVREFWCSACKAWHVGHAPETRRIKSDEPLDDDDETWYA